MRILFSFNFQPPNQQQLQYLDELLKFVQNNQHYQVCLNQIFQIEPANQKQQKLVYSDEQSGHYIFKNTEWRKDKKSGRIYYINKQVIEAQNQVLKYLIKSIGRNLFSGMSLLNISLPVVIFEHRSNLERIAFSQCFAPHYLEKAGLQENPTEQMKNCMTFFLTTMIMYTIISKPFNPLMGETFQGFINGLPIYCEQISHHPPICAYQLIGKSFTVNGQIESKASVHLNRIATKNIGIQSIIFKNSQKRKIQYIAPACEIGNTTIGERYVQVIGQSYTLDLDNKLLGIINFNPDKKKVVGNVKMPINYINGGIYKMKDSFVSFLIKSGNQLEKVMKDQSDIEQQTINKLSDITGFWDEEIKFDQEILYNQDNPLPYNLEYEKYPLASDSNFRQDIIAWRTKKSEFAQTWKEQLENDQRRDRELRKKFLLKKNKIQ